MIPAYTIKNLKNWDTLFEQDKDLILTFTEREIDQQMLEAAIKGQNSITVYVLLPVAEILINKYKAYGYNIQTNDWQLIPGCQTLTILW